MLNPTSFFLIGAIALLSGCSSISLIPSSSEPATQTASATTPFSNQGYGRVLQTYVDADGLVDYAALQANPQELQDYIAELGAVSPATYDAWSDSDKIAFLINAYNAITLESIIAQDPLKGSIKDILGVWTFNKHTVMGRSLTLDMIEHEILRKDFQEPRIHAALVCAAISCPPLRQEPFTGADLDAQLDDQVQRWLTGSHGLAIDRTQNQVSISAIFNWFGEDWQGQYAVDDRFAGNDRERAVLNFISNYVGPEDREYLEQGQYTVNYLHYDWSLNRQ